MLRHFGLTSRHPLLETLDGVAFWGLACVAVGVVLLAVYRSLLASNHDEKRLRAFLLVFAVLALPGALLGIWAVEWLDDPIRGSSLSFVLEELGSTETAALHVGVILAMLILAVLALVWRYRPLEVLDAMFLYLPVGLAIGSLACTIAGFGFGRSISLEIWGLRVRFDNPIPLYSILLDVSIFSFLKRLYARTRLDRSTRERYEGSVVASCLLLYGLGQGALDAFRGQRTVLIELTQSQFVLLGLVAVGLGVLWMIGRRGRHEPDIRRVDVEAARAVTTLFSLLGLAASYLAFMWLTHYLTFTLRLLPTPFHPADSIADAYQRVAGYVPVLSLPLLSVYFLRRGGLPIAGAFVWRRTPAVFWIALAVSLVYAVVLLVSGEQRLRGIEYWPAVVILSLMNAGSEEIVYRLGFLGLLRGVDYPRWVAIVVQSLLYSAIHFAISPAFGVASFFYGLLLGMVMDRSRSVVPCILCHFVIDLGGIGLPLLSH